MNVSVMDGAFALCTSIIAHPTENESDLDKDDDAVVGA